MIIKYLLIGREYSIQCEEGTMNRQGVVYPINGGFCAMEIHLKERSFDIVTSLCPFLKYLRENIVKNQGIANNSGMKLIS